MFNGIFSDKVKSVGYILNDNVPEPEMCNFFNTDKAIRLIKRAVQENKYILIHCDIDMDGIGSGYIMYKFFALENSANKVKMLINRQRSHGITQNFVNVVNSLQNVGLVIILDSSSNELEYIKQINTDVLVIDHHNIDHNELNGKTANGEYTIVNNVVPSDTYTVDKRMSAGLVVYELLRHYYLGIPNKLDEELMFNWVCVTLYTDAILLDNARNQYYLEKSLNSDQFETNLYKLLQLSRQTELSKNSIQYYLAPRINSAIRAEQSLKALNCVIYDPLKLQELNEYKDLQAKYLQDVDSNINQTDSYILKNITDTGVSRAYCGVIASRLCSKYHKNVVVYVEENGLYQGSFRGRCDDVSYLSCFKERAEFVQGHDCAFGFKAKPEEINGIMQSLVDKEPIDSRQFYITAGDMPDKVKGKYHISNTAEMDRFKKERHLLNLSLINSRLSSQEAINIIVMNNDLEYEIDGFGIYRYSLLGLKAKSFSPINTQYAALYIEFCNGVDIYIKEYYV